MAYRIEKTTAGQDVVIDGFHAGIADSPYLGIADMRNVNIISSPEEVSVGYATTGLNVPPTVTTVAFSVDSTTDTFTVANTAGFFNGMAITFNTIVSATGFSTGRVYWIGNLSSTTFKIYKSIDRAIPSLVDVTGSGSGTYSSYTLSTPIDKTIAYGVFTNAAFNYVFILDDNGRAWWVDTTQGIVSNNLIYIGNDTLTGSTGRAIKIFQNYIIVFRTGTTDILPVASMNDGSDPDAAPFAGWKYGWESVSSVIQNPRPAIAAQDDALYYANGSRLGSILVNAGMNFDPNDPTTYTKNTSALDLPDNDQVTALAELGTNLLVGGIRNFIYPWDRISTSFTYPLILAENYTTRIVTSNANSYIFAGNRGRIYITNGSNVQLFKKIPDAITNTTDPYFTWEDAVYWKNQLYFSFNASSNAGIALGTTSGVWAIDLDSNSFRYTNELSYGAFTGTTTVLVQNVLTSTPGGAGLYIGWVNSGSFGVDVTTSVPYTGGQTYIDSDLIPIGTFLTKKTFQNLEFKLSKPLVTGESVQLLTRSSLSDSFVSQGTTSTAGLLSDQPYQVNFEMKQWVQIRTILTSTASSPSFVPLREIRIR